MSRLSPFLSILLLSLLAVSCQKAPAPVAPPNAILADASSGLVIRSGQGLYDITDGTAKWSAALLLWEKVGLTGQSAKGKLSDGRCSTHIDVVGRKFDIWADDRMIMRRGEFVLNA